MSGTHISQTTGLIPYKVGMWSCVYRGHKIRKFDRNWLSGYRDTRGWKWQVSGSYKYVKHLCTTWLSWPLTHHCVSWYSNVHDIIEVTNSILYIDSLATIFMLVKFHLGLYNVPSIIYGNIPVVNKRWYQVTARSGGNE